MGAVRLSDLLDLAIVQSMAEAHYRAAGMPIGVIDAIDGSILVVAGWQDICLKFHRAHPVALQRCRESDDYIKGRLAKGEACAYRCKNGLWDIGMPIVVAGEHLATMFLGQFFYEDEAPDRDLFERQANEFGFDVSDYLAALDRVPVFDREKVDYILEYDKALVAFIAAIAEQSLLRNRADEAVRESERKFHAIFDHAYQFIGLLTLDGTVLEVNDTSLMFSGATEGEVVGKPFWEASLWSHSAKLQERVREAVKTAAEGELVRFEATHRAAGGQLHDFDFSLKPVTDESGKVVLLIPESRDITDRKKAECEKQKLLEQLAMSQKMESIGRLAGGVAHDFNNMLSIIIGYSELILLRLEQDDPLRQELNEIYAAAERSRDIARQLLTFARKGVTEPKVLDMNRCVEGTLKVLRSLVGEEVELIWHPGAGLWPVMMDSSQLDQIVANLCVNAREAIADVGRIVVETGTTTLGADYCSARQGLTPGEFLWLSVSDDGCGMDRETIDRAFEPFFTTKQSSGLGLSTVYGIVKQNNGCINVYSEPGEGTTARVYLPRYVGSLVAEGLPDPDEVPPGRGETVLVVEDEGSILRLAEVVLVNHNYRVLTAKSPGEALDLARGCPGEIALLVTDVVMPDMNGCELAAQIREVVKDVKCLYMSGYTANIISERGVLEKDSRFIQKPWTSRDLALKVRETLDA